MEKTEKVRIEELSVGDWVYAKTEEGKKIAKVCYRSEKFAAAEATDGSEYIGKQFDGVFSCIEPIPLTPEILVKNGFTHDKWSERIWVYEDEESEVVYYIECGKLEITTYDCKIAMVCKSVAELQRALRLAKVGKEIKL